MKIGDIFLKDVERTPRVEALRESYFEAIPEVCVERPRLITRYCLEHDLFEKDVISVLEAARMYRHVLENREAVINHEEARTQNRQEPQEGLQAFKPDADFLSLFAGSTTTKYKGVPLYPEFLALTIWPELWTISKRESNPYHITPADVEELNHEIFPHWMHNNILETARKRCYAENERKYGRKKQAPEIKLTERLVFFLGSKANCISHYPESSVIPSAGDRGLVCRRDAAPSGCSSSG